jgi:hypothetical protein
MTSSISAVDIGRVQVADSAQYVASILAASEVRFSCVVVAPIPARQVAPQMRRMLWNRVKGGFWTNASSVCARAESGWRRRWPVQSGRKA